MIKTIVNAWKIADLRKKLIFTVLMVVVFRIGCAFPVPFVNITDGILSDSTANNFMTYLSMMTGNAFNYGTLFAMSVTPYINASIIIQLLTVAIPPLQKLSQEGEEGRKKMGKITRYSAAGLALMQSTAYYFYIKSQGFLTTDPKTGMAYTGFAGVFQAAVIILCYTAGAAFIIWLGDLINEKGVGNGISIILFAGIVSRIPTIIYQLYFAFNRGGKYYALAPIAAVILILMIAYIVWMDNAERRIPVQYAKRVVGRKMYGGQSSHIPIKVNMCGVLPIIFASSILSLPPTIGMFVPAKTADSFWAKFLSWFNSDSVIYGIIYFILIIFFAYFYAAIQYNPIEMSNNIRNQGGVIPGIRAGRPTSEFITRVLNRLTLLGALLLSVVAVLPIVFTQVSKLIGAESMNISLGGTSIIIVVGVALETVKQLESQMMMRHYKGFLD